MTGKTVTRQISVKRFTMRLACREVNPHKLLKASLPKYPTRLLGASSEIILLRLVYGAP